MQDRMILMKSSPLNLIRRIGFQVRRPANPTESRSTSYAIFFIVTGLMCQLLFFIPLYYFFEQNYSVFTELSFDSAAPLVEHLGRERQWLRGFLISAVIAQALFFLVFGSKIFHRIFSPIEVIKKKITSLSKGYWRPWPLKLRKRDELSEIVENLNYLSATLHAHAKNEIQILSKIRKNLQDPEQIFLMDQMLQIKSRQTGLALSTETSSASIDSTRDSDLAS